MQRIPLISEYVDPRIYPDYIQGGGLSWDIFWKIRPHVFLEKEVPSDNIIIVYSSNEISPEFLFHLMRNFTLSIKNRAVIEK